MIFLIHDIEDGGYSKQNASKKEINSWDVRILLLIGIGLEEEFKRILIPT